MSGPNITLDEQLAPLAAQLADILAAKSALEEDERAIKATIRHLVPGPDTYSAGDVVTSTCEDCGWTKNGTPVTTLYAQRQHALFGCARRPPDTQIDHAARAARPTKPKEPTT